MERYFKITEIPESEFVKKTGERWIGVQTYGVLDDSIYIGVDCDMTSRMVVELEDLEWPCKIWEVNVFFLLSGILKPKKLTF